MNRSIITGVIVAGGKSSRMGMDKGALILGNKYLVQYSIDALKSICSGLLISTQNEWYAQLGYPLVKDRIKDCGPIGGIYSSLLAAETPYILALACDMPFVSTQILEKLTANIHAYDCVVPRIGNKYEPLCAVYSKELIPAMEQRIHAGHYALHDLIEKSNHLFLDFSNDAAAFMNLNTMSDLDKGKQLL
jgi:molybdopterin-guanine dinucleotide biosynthesis protein A